MKILVYGDSNVWGDNFYTRVRLNDDVRWANILEKKLGKNCKVIEEGLPGRLAGSGEEVKTYKNGQNTFISIFRSSSPVDMVIIALGTNDLQVKYNKDVDKIVDDLVWYKNCILEQFSDPDDQKKYFVNKRLPRIIYIMPPNFDYINRSDIFDKQSESKRKILSINLRERINDEILELNDLPLVDDGIHLSIEGHKMVAESLYELIGDLDD